MFRFLMVLTISSTVGLKAWLTLFNNFAVEVAHLDGSHIGMIQSVREIPGFLSLLAIFVMLIIKEHRLSALSILGLGLGLAATGWFPSYMGLMFTTLIMSFGFHYYETTNQSLTLQYFDATQSPWVLARIRSWASASSVAIGILIYGLAALLNYTQIYLIIGGGHRRRRYLGPAARSDQPGYCAAAQEDDFSPEVLALLFPDLYERRPPSDFYGLCRLPAGETVRVHPAAHHHPVCGE